ncbi:MAG TPA: glycosyltransferase family 39 protein [Pseudonocardiaceae bacterium]|jgi:hypothetical protein|nr:glycosyltransferase family 39 protein [Pseudonocardiaceae bacterium]
MSETGELTRTDRREVPKIAWRPVGAITALAGVIHLAVATRYGWHRDEFYYVISGRHPAWGYVDQPPLTPFLARLAADLPGGVLPLRVLAIAAQLGCILLAAKLAAELGGRTRGQSIAAAAIAASPAFVASSVLFGTTVTDQLFWAAAFVAMARALRVNTIPAWLLVGAVLGLGMENKNTVIVLVLGVAVGLVVWRRETFRTAGPWLAAAVATVLELPNAIWAATNGFPEFQMAAVLSARSGGPLGSLAQVPVLLLLLAGPPLIALWVLGARWLWRNREWRWLLTAAAVVLVAFTASGGKSYYPAPALVALFAAGAVHFDQENGSTVRLRIAIIVGGVFAVLIGLPILPAGVQNAVRALNPTPLETFGWPSFVDQVHQVADTLPPDTPIFTSNYGEAGALTILGPGQGVHNPIVSSQNAYGTWGPPAGTPTEALCVGEFTPDQLHRGWSDVRKIAPITMPDNVRDEEVDNHATIYLCQRPHGTWAQLWPVMKHVD